MGNLEGPRDGIDPDSPDTSHNGVSAFEYDPSSGRCRIYDPITKKFETPKGANLVADFIMNLFYPELLKAMKKGP